ncbi:TetR/AcrR family transcriptional regulator [Kaistia dalseonensis]|uniref:AcrR family transcriptional regulator n=1 Tax=Kaistia dalseonensis TaxID=410840 RepID=A0ABU0H3E9_9HYPH|nr:TetR/AcrR family transcriptional regulator [Kaistia dalseonensis]MCX5493442.1 TetR/AcrR family transcriptional regulator [Kaistia dalseonensis]MDQ0436001.1 AcrR family transcriptional regulator [Kaistia dalseonensis]
MDARADERTVHPAMDDRSLPPRARILIAAQELFVRHGFHGVGVETIAEAAGTNKMTLYRHFESKDLLIAECLRGIAGENDSVWSLIDSACPNDPRGQIMTWLRSIGEHTPDGNHVGCALVNAAIQITDPDHPGRKVVEESKRAHRNKLVSLCQAAGYSDPELLADQLFLIVEGARVSYRSAGPDGIGANLLAMAENIMAAHEP